MRTFTIGLLALISLGLVATTGCDGNWCLGDDCSTDCGSSRICDQGCRCWGDCGCDCGCADDGWDDGWGQWCTSDADCPAGQVCHPDGTCVEVVADCPLSDECLGDPEGYTSDWQGIDPMFVGAFTGPDGAGRIELMMDFYPDHVYGEAQVVVTDPDGWPVDWVWVVVTGSRDGESIWGQIVDANAWERDFDAVFEATLLSASEMVGQVTITDDDGETSIDFQLSRTSPCGCPDDAGCDADADCPAGQACEDGTCQDAQDPDCQADADCPSGQLCVRGECLAICFEDGDCPAGQVCQEHACVDGCSSECCADADCGDGEACVDGACQPICQTECCADADCEDGEACVDGACQPTCQTECCADADCALGYECVEGECLNPCVHWCDCEEGEDCIDGYCRPAG